MPYEKRRRFSLKEMPTGFSNRQLVDSSYIATAVVDYLKLLGIPVSTTRGQITAELRRQWGLNNILKKDGDEGTEKARDDHRHHAVDAVTIALTTRSHINTLKRKYDFGRGERFPSPFDKAGIDRDSFRSAVKQCIETINVSHRPQRRVAGCLE